MKDDGEFRGWVKTAKKILEEKGEGSEMKEKKLVKRLIKVYKLSKEYEKEDSEKLKEKASAELKKKKSILEYKDGKVKLVEE